MRLKSHYIVFEASDKPDKGLVVGKVNGGPGKYALAFFAIENDGATGYGDSFDVDAITEAYTTLFFCKRESVDAMIAALKCIRDQWEQEEPAVS